MYLINVAILYKYQPCMPRTIYPVVFFFHLSVCFLVLSLPLSLEFLIDLALAVFPLLLTVLAPSRHPNPLVEADFWTPILSPRATHKQAAPWDCLSYHQVMGPAVAA
jgi:hypothetical protein